jgi:hypothetical protein
VIELGNNPNKIEQSYSKLIRAAWQDDASLRPCLYLLFLELDELSKSNPILKEKSSSMLKPQKYNNDGEVIEIFYYEEDDKKNNKDEGKGDEQLSHPVINKDSNLDIVPIVTVNPSLSLMSTFGEDDKKVYENNDFKSAADQGIPDAQFSYAKYLIESCNNDENNDDGNGDGNNNISDISNNSGNNSKNSLNLKYEEILKYLELAAHGDGIPSAFFLYFRYDLFKRKI